MTYTRCTRNSDSTSLHQLACKYWTQVKPATTKFEVCGQHPANGLLKAVSKAVNMCRVDSIDQEKVTAAPEEWMSDKHVTNTICSFS